MEKENKRSEENEDKVFPAGTPMSEIAEYLVNDFEDFIKENGNDGGELIMNTQEQKKEAEVAFQRGKAYYEKKEYDLAIKEYSDAILIDPNFIPVYYKRLSASSRWLTKLSLEELRIKARECEKPKPPEPIIINNIPIHKNKSAELLEGEIFKKNSEKDVEVSNLGRVKYDDCILEQYDPKNNGYLFVDIKSMGKNVSEKVYRLVAETWLERLDIKGQSKIEKNDWYNTIHHISNNGYDNRIENLMWVTEWQHAMIHPWMSIDNFNFKELSDLFYSYAYINIPLNEYQRIINIAKRMQQLENTESKSPGKYDYWYENIIEALEDLIKNNTHSIGI